MNANQRFGFWTVVDGVVTPKADGYRLLCRCDCGTTKMVMKKPLLKGTTKSCGCHGVYPGSVLSGHVVLERNGRDLLLRCAHGATFTSRYAAGGIRMQTCPCNRDFSKHARHGESVHAERTSEYNAWRQMRQRCNLPTHKHYPHYGGRGISVCARWDDYANFLEDMGRRPSEDHSIDRIDVNGNYEPGNCRWATRITQARNKRGAIYLTLHGETLHLKEWAERLGLQPGRLYQRAAKTSDVSIILREAL
jgi:hypothetical protein